MENNQFNPQTGQPSPTPQQGQQFAQPQQGQQMGQQFAQPQQGQQMGQQFAQPQQGQQMGQQFAQPQQMQPVAPKAPMSIEQRTLWLAISLLAIFVLFKVSSANFSRYFDNSGINTLFEIFNTFFLIGTTILEFSILILGALLFTPKLATKITNYVNIRSIIILLSITSAVVAALSFISLIIFTAQRSSSNLSYVHNYLFSMDFITLPCIIGAAVFAIVLALPLPQNKLLKDRFVVALTSTVGTILISVFFLFIFSFFGKI